jgi:hypothetical protein
MSIVSIVTTDFSLTDRFGRNNAGLVIEMLLRKHIDHADICLSACLAFNALADVPNNRNYLRKIGADFYECLLAVLTRYDAISKVPGLNLFEDPLFRFYRIGTWTTSQWSPLAAFASVACAKRTINERLRMDLAQQVGHIA